MPDDSWRNRLRHLVAAISPSAIVQQARAPWVSTGGDTVARADVREQALPAAREVFRPEENPYYREDQPFDHRVPVADAEGHGLPRVLGDGPGDGDPGEVWIREEDDNKISPLRRAVFGKTSTSTRNL